MNQLQLLTNFLFEVGTLRKIARAHRQTLLTNDITDNISSHSYRTAIIGMLLASIEKANVGKVVIMCLSHDWPETRGNDHNWIHKLYVRMNTEGIIEDQRAIYNFQEIADIITEYEERKTPESKIAKDADTVDQLLLLKEYEMQGNQEAARWLHGRTNKRPYAWVDRMVLDSTKALGRVIYDTIPSDWWNGMYSNKNLPFEK